MQGLVNKYSKYFVLFIAAGGTVLSFQNCGQGFTALNQVAGIQNSGSTDNNGAGSGSGDSDSNGGDTGNLPPPPDTSVDYDKIAAPCWDADYQGFACLQKTLTTSEGKAYRVMFRWNRLNKPSQGTVVWVLGGSGKGKWRTNFKESAPIQDEFDTTHSLRSIEVEFTDDAAVASLNDGYFIHAGGYYSAASAYMEALKFISLYLKKGTFLNHVGGSNGTMVAAYALSHFNAGAYLDRAIMHAGPFLPDIQDACNNSHYAAFAKSPQQLSAIHNLLSIWAFGKEGLSPCRTLPNDRLSVLHAGTVTSYPKTALHVMMGQKEIGEGFGAWIIESNAQWYAKVQAAEKTRYVASHLGHEMDWVAVRRDARLSPPTRMGPAPVAMYSLSENGAATTTVPVNATVYGVVSNIDSSSAMGCMEEGERLVVCDNPKNWVRMPNAEWSFSNGKWRSQFVPAKIGAQAGKTYIGFYVNAKTGQKSEAIRLNVTP